MTFYHFFFINFDSGDSMNSAYHNRLAVMACKFVTTVDNYPCHQINSHFQKLWSRSSQTICELGP